MPIWKTQSELYAGAYGEPGNSDRNNFNPEWLRENIAYVICPWVLTDGRNHFGHIGIHKNVAQSLSRVLHNVYDACGKSQAEIDKHRYNIFSGSLCYRPMRTSMHLSMHSYGVALDWDAPDNPLGSYTHRFAVDELLFVKFREEGWVCGIDWSRHSIDAMHVQAARVD